MIKAIAIASAMLLTAGSANAAVTFNLSNVTFGTGGTLFGSFTTNDDLTAITSYDITATASGAFLGFRYTPVTAPISAATLPSQFVQFDSPGNVNELRLYFTTPLTRAGTTLNPVFSYEHEPSGGNRSPSGAILAASTQPAAVPEMATWAMMLVGLGFVGGALRSRRSMPIQRIA